MCTLSFMLPLIIQSSPNHSISWSVTKEARKFKPYMSQFETLGGANQLSYKAFGQLQIIYILELSNTLVPKSFIPTSISWYPSIYNRLLLDFSFLWNFVNCILETKDFVRWCCILRLKAIQSSWINYKIHIVCGDNLLCKLNERHVAHDKEYH